MNLNKLSIKLVFKEVNRKDYLHSRLTKGQKTMNSKNNKTFTT